LHEVIYGGAGKLWCQPAYRRKLPSRPILSWSLCPGGNGLPGRPASRSPPGAPLHQYGIAIWQHPCRNAQYGVWKFIFFDQFQIALPREGIAIILRATGIGPVGASQDT